MRVCKWALYGVTMVGGVGLVACTPPEVRQRVDFSLNAQGQCLVAQQAVECKEAGALAVRQHKGMHVSAVLFIDPQATPERQAALNIGLREAQITHIQYGDVRSQTQRSHPPGADD